MQAEWITLNMTGFDSLALYLEGQDDNPKFIYEKNTKKLWSVRSNYFAGVRECTYSMMTTSGCPGILPQVDRRYYGNEWEQANEPFFRLGSFFLRAPTAESISIFVFGEKNEKRGTYRITKVVHAKPCM